MSDRRRIEKHGDRLWLVCPDKLVERSNFKEGDLIDSSIIESVLGTAARRNMQKRA